MQSLQYGDTRTLYRKQHIEIRADNLHAILKDYISEAKQNINIARNNNHDMFSQLCVLTAVQESVKSAAENL